MRVESLRRLSNYLRTLRDKDPDLCTFNMSYWYKGDYPIEGDIPCGTSACAAGHAAIALPELELVAIDDGEFTGHIFLKNNIDSKYRGVFTNLAEAFKISEDELRYLFDPLRYNTIGSRITPEQVADRIDQLLERETNASN